MVAIARITKKLVVGAVAVSISAGRNDDPVDVTKEVCTAGNSRLLSIAPSSLALFC